MNSSGSSGNGTGSDSNRAMNEKDQAAHDFNKSLQPPEAALGSVNTNCYAGQNSGNVLTSPESPIDPRLSPPSSADTSPTSIMGDKKLRKSSRTYHKDSLSSEPTLIQHDSQDSADIAPIHRNRGERDTWYQSKESLASAEAARQYSIENAPPVPAMPRRRSRSNSSSPPSPSHKPVSRGRQPRSRPTTADTQRSFFDDQSSHHAVTTDERIETDSLHSVGYPGRLDSEVHRGIARTTSGRETYLPDGIIQDLRDGSVERSLERRLSDGSSNGRRLAARGAGRGF